jgi:hypothetical protein
MLIAVHTRDDRKRRSPKQSRPNDNFLRGFMALEIEKGKVYKFIVEGQEADYTVTFSGLFWGENKILILRFNPNDTPNQTMFLTPDQMTQVEDIKEA